MFVSTVNSDFVNSGFILSSIHDSNVDLDENSLPVDDTDMPLKSCSPCIILFSYIFLKSIGTSSISKRYSWLSFEIASGNDKLGSKLMPNFVQRSIVSFIMNGSNLSLPANT